MSVLRDFIGFSLALHVDIHGVVRLFMAYLRTVRMLQLDVADVLCSVIILYDTNRQPCSEQ